MSKLNRRTFIASSALTLGATATSFAMETEKPVLVHNVFFWLKNPSSLEDRTKLIEGVKTLSKIETIRMLRVGVPASTEKRPVVDSSYAVSELIYFDDLAGQSVYQDHPIHKKFIENCSHLWEKVVVYDSIDA
jgi:hypothetical protein